MNEKEGLFISDTVKNIAKRYDDLLTSDDPLWEKDIDGISKELYLAYSVYSLAFNIIGYGNNMIRDKRGWGAVAESLTKIQVLISEEFSCGRLKDEVVHKPKPSDCEILRADFRKNNNRLPE